MVFIFAYYNTDVKRRKKEEHEMKKLTNNKLNELVNKALESGNPYIAKAIRFHKGNEEMFDYYGTIYTKAELDEAYKTTAAKDIRNGYNERMVGYYDKWYRYSRADEGRAYDLGVRLAADDEGCESEMHIIECA